MYTEYGVIVYLYTIGRVTVRLNYCVKKVNGPVELLMELRLTGTGCNLPYGITQCYLSPDTSEHTPP